MKKIIPIVTLCFFAACSLIPKQYGPEKENNMLFPELATVWDEAIPLGNGMMGSLVWQNEGRLRFSLDRADLWDLRSISYLEQDEFNFDWVYKKWKEDDYGKVQALFDTGAYSNSIAPSKIPGAALEFEFPGMDSVISAELNLADARCIVKWANGVELETFIQADESLGWFKFSGPIEDIKIILVPPVYQKEGSSEMVDEVTGQELTRLAYEQGKVLAGNNELSYHQKGWEDFYYDVKVKWENKSDHLIGSWSMSTSLSEAKGIPDAGSILDGSEVMEEKLKNYIDDRCKNKLLFINIESQPAVDNLKELLSVNGVDGVIIGPHDLSCSMGLPEEYTNPTFEKTVTKIINECNKRNLGIGIHLSEEPEQQIKWSKLGVNIILHSSDISLFGKILNNEITSIKEGLKDKVTGSDYSSTTI